MNFTNHKRSSSVTENNNNNEDHLKMLEGLDQELQHLI